MGKKKYEDRVKFLHERAGSLASDGRFSKGDYEALSDDYGKVKGWGVGGKKSDLSRYIARALYENDAVLDSAAEDLANKYNKGGLIQSKDSSGRLQTSFKESTGGGSPLDRLRQPYFGEENKEWYEGEYANAPISNIENKSWTDYTPAGKSTSKWDVYTRTYAHAPKQVEAEESASGGGGGGGGGGGASKESPADFEPRQDLDASEGQGSMKLGKYGKKLELDPRIPEEKEAKKDISKKRFQSFLLPGIGPNIGMATSGLESNGIRDVYDYYSKQITS